MENNFNLTPEMLEKAKSASSAAALLALAQENGITLTAEEAETYYAQLHPEIGALSDEELDNVSGGSLCYDDSTPPEKCRFCGHILFEYRKKRNAWVTHWYWYCINCDRKDS